MPTEPDYSRFFQDTLTSAASAERPAAPGPAPHPWQRALGEDPTLRDRLIAVPTGLGKTAGVVLAWAYHAVVRRDAAWPRRLIFTLPMRVLVEQAKGEVEGWRAQIKATYGVDFDLHLLLGGVEAAAIALAPDRPAVLIGTQDMLLSRALNRGYAAAPARWPAEFGVLHQDALWVLDEVQLMGVGAVTAAQLQAFRASAGDRGLRPSATWWMSATLRSQWLETVAARGVVAAAAEAAVSVPVADQEGPLWEITKVLERHPDRTTPDEVAGLVASRHAPATLTLVVVNTVARAVEVHDALAKALRTRGEQAPDLRLVHSRFRPYERGGWQEAFLNRAACSPAQLPAGGRVVVATQVIEAGVDMSAALLVTELAPWPSLVQRFGRLARYAGQTGVAVVVGALPDDEKKAEEAARPYAVGELAAAAGAVGELLAGEARVDIAALERFARERVAADPALAARLYPFEVAHVLQRRDVDDLFDTSGDLSGGDVDVSRFVRGGDEHDVTVFWREAEELLGRSKQAADAPGGGRLAVGVVGAVARDEMCQVPVGEARKWLEGRRAWIRDFNASAWEWLARSRRLVPGMQILVDAAEGGYDPARGFDGKSKRPVLVVPVLSSVTAATAGERFDAAAATDDADDLSVQAWKTIATHTREAAAEVTALCLALGLPARWVRVLELAARWHDVGKAHEVFQGALGEAARSEAGMTRGDLAKGPDHAWRRPAYPARPGFRHELVSALALFELLRRRDPWHEALLGPWAEVFEALDEVPSVGEPLAASGLADEVARLSGPDFDLLVYLVASHHGKVRCSLASSPRDDEAGHGTVRGVRDGDVLPEVTLHRGDGALEAMPALALSLELAKLGLSPRYGASWAERVVGLMTEHGPFRLAYLEALLRAADVRASQLSTGDELL